MHLPLSPTSHALFCRFAGSVLFDFRQWTFGREATWRPWTQLQSQRLTRLRYPLGAQLKTHPLLYCTVSISSGPFCPSPQVFLMSLSVIRWLSSSVRSSLPPVPLISLVLDDEGFCHTESAQRSYKCPVALIKKVQDESSPSAWISSFHTCTVEGGDSEDTFPPELFGWSPWPSSHFGTVRFIWCHVNTCLVVQFGWRIKKNYNADAHKDKFSWNLQSHDP